MTRKDIMNIGTKKHQGVAVFRLAVVILSMICLAGGLASVVRAQPDESVAGPDQRVITIYDQGKKRVVLSKERSVKKTLAYAGVDVTSHDRVEPAIESEFADNTQTYTINIYRARPVTIIDGMKRYRVLSPYGTARDVAKDAGVTVYTEDTLRLERSSDLLADGVGSRLIIERATPLTLVLYGESTQVYTQQATVEEFLKEKQITLATDDTLSVDPADVIVEGMRIEVWRNGVQTVTEQQEVAFEIEQVQDADRETGYREVKTPGVKGEKTVTYEVVMKNGQEVERREIQSVVTKQPEHQVEIVGAKPSFGGDFAAALAKLRACEAGGDYANKRNPLYRGAYQFGYTTWGGYGGYRDPADAPPAVQDQAARELYERRGWQPWPSCGASLPDTYR